MATTGLGASLAEVIKFLQLLAVSPSGCLRKSLLPRFLPTILWKNLFKNQILDKKKLPRGIRWVAFTACLVDLIFWFFDLLG
ncbi:hypothetical protein ES332_A05G249100v1 [Gossypium tomentosum]|uniref:Uncharacterized protein n=1 Tax=Gossypium tomentosum TaxID=34277 RepID=A0A5D2QIL0_GOSTO|nr:hypothetical protein ES332_A05G249100v1 [Gossypium tomentosum]